MLGLPWQEQELGLELVSLQQQQEPVLEQQASLLQLEQEQPWPLLVQPSWAQQMLVLSLPEKKVEKVSTHKKTSSILILKCTSD